MPRTLPAALDAVRAAASPEARLAALLDAWRIAKLSELAAAIEQLSKDIYGKRAPLAGKTIDAKNESWTALAAKMTSADVEQLLTEPSTLDTHGFGSWLGRTFDAKLAAIAKWPADPRVARELVSALDHVSDVPTLEVPILRLIARNGDPRGLARLRAVAKRGNSAEYPPVTSKAELAKTIAKLAAAFPHGPPKPDRATAKALRELGSAERGKRKSETALLAEIYANPDDDAARLVYADALQEKGDPRGEYIALAIRHEHGELDAPGRGRMRQLLSANKARWSLPLEPALTSSGGPREFRRGFLSRCKITGVAMSDERRIRAIYKHPAWALVDEVLVSKPGLEFRAPLVAHLRKLGVKLTIV